jgi:hypothetical protein
MLTAMLALVATLAAGRACPIAAATALPEMTGAWDMLLINRLDRPRPDTVRATATIAADLQACLLHERVTAVTGTPPYEALVVWGVNGADSTIQRVFAHSQHGRLGVYQGRRMGSDIALRQIALSPQPDSVVVENLVVIRDRDHFTITSRLSNDRGRTWQALSRWEYRRKSS